MQQISLFFIFLILSSAVWGRNEYPELTQLYAKITGFGISDGEKDTIKSAGGAPTYGEIFPRSVSILLKDLKLTAEDVFYDLGSGVGKVAVQVYLDSPVKKSVGVELSPTRHSHAIKVQGRLKDAGKLKANRVLVFCQENILHTDISDATVLFLCSTCYSDELMAGVADKIQQLKIGTRVITLKAFKSPTSLKLVKTYQLPMTWSESNTVHLYQVV
jgi:precorrin-6B methylase 2